MPKYMKSMYVYSKLRKDFGRQPLFQQVPAHILDSINPDKEEQKRYILRNPVHRDVLAVVPQSEHEANTKEIGFRDRGVNHTEGGWPREVHLFNEEHVARHRRRVLHEENYIHTVMNITPVMRHYIDQNNAIDMYQTYFSEMQAQPPVEKYNVRIVNVFRDTLRRPVSCIAWTNEKNSKLAVSYCHKSCPPETELNKSNICYLWDVHRQTVPINEIHAEHPCWQLACSPSDAELLITGLENGTVHVFDVRDGTKAISRSSVYNSHRGPITALLYTHSRTNTEFFTGSSDGRCLWWDKRDLSKPIDELLMSVRLSPGEEPNINNAEGVSALEFDRGLPTKFICGTESGLVINVNRMGKNHSEVLPSYWNAHVGQVRAVHRSPCTMRMFLTCGDWSIRVWSEEVRTAPIIVTRPYRHEVTDVSWAPLQYSSYMAVCADGAFHYWDFLRKYQEPIATLQVSKYKLTKLVPHTNGQSVAIGNDRGSIFLLQLSENMISPGTQDKQLMYHTYERETRREHYLDTRLKEIRLKVRGEEVVTAPAISKIPDKVELEKGAEEEYFKMVNEELREIGGVSTSSNISIFKSLQHIQH